MLEKDSQRVASLLKQANLRTTNTRVLILKEFINAGNKALSSNEIEQKLQNLDRITLYRSLKSFEETGIIHQAVDVSGKVKYALCSNDCSPKHHHDHHAHFYCKKCEKTVCLDQVSIPPVVLPIGFVLEDSQLVLSGVCDKCGKHKVTKDI